MRDREAIEAYIAEFCAGWREKVEFGVKIGGDIEKRAERVHIPSLLSQLDRVALDGAAPGDKCERTAPNKPASRPPGSMRGIELLDRIHEEAQYCYNLILNHEGRESIVVRKPVVVTLRNILLSLDSIEHQPRIMREIADIMRRWRSEARMLLGYDRPTKMLADAACGDCGDQLAVHDGSVLEVRCIGTGCGRSYPHTQWLELLRNDRT